MLLCSRNGSNNNDNFKETLFRKYISIYKYIDIISVYTVNRNETKTLNWILNWTLNTENERNMIWHSVCNVIQKKIIISTIKWKECAHIAHIAHSAHMPNALVHKIYRFFCVDFFVDHTILFTFDSVHSLLGFKSSA